MNHPGPEVYAPPDRRVPEEPSSGARVAFLRPQTVEHSQSNDRSAENLDALIQRVAGGSMDEIDHVIRELEGIREMLRVEGERVSQQIAAYAGLCQSSTTVMKIFSNSLKVWKDSSDLSAR